MRAKREEENPILHALLWLTSTTLDLFTTGEMATEEISELPNHDLISPLEVVISFEALCSAGQAAMADLEGLRD